MKEDVKTIVPIDEDIIDVHDLLRQSTSQELLCEVKHEEDVSWCPPLIGDGLTTHDADEGVPDNCNVMFCSPEAKTSKICLQMCERLDSTKVITLDNGDSGFIHEEEIFCKPGVFESTSDYEGNTEVRPRSKRTVSVKSWQQKQAEEYAKAEELRQLKLLKKKEKQNTKREERQEDLERSRNRRDTEDEAKREKQRIQCRERARRFRLNEDAEKREEHKRRDRERARQQRQVEDEEQKEERRRKNRERTRLRRQRESEQEREERQLREKDRAQTRIDTETKLEERRRKNRERARIRRQAEGEQEREERNRKGRERQRLHRATRAPDNLLREEGNMKKRLRYRKWKDSLSEVALEEYRAQHREYVKIKRINESEADRQQRLARDRSYKVNKRKLKTGLPHDESQKRGVDEIEFLEKKEAIAGFDTQDYF